MELGIRLRYQGRWAGCQGLGDARDPVSLIFLSFQRWLLFWEACPLAERIAHSTGRPCCSGMMCVLDFNFTDHGSVTRALPQHRDKVRAPSKPVSRGWGEARGCSFWPTMKKHTSALKQVHFPGLHSKGMRRTSWLLTFDSIPEFLFLDKWITNISTTLYTLESSFTSLNWLPWKLCEISSVGVIWFPLYRCKNRSLEWGRILPKH